MACANRNQSSGTSNWLDDLNALNIFGNYRAEDIELSENERKEKERKFRLAEIEKEKERQRQEELRKEQEIADWEYANEAFGEEDRRSRGIKRNGLSHHISRRSRGRGDCLNEAVKQGNSIVGGRGRGHMSIEEKEALHLYCREQKVQKTINQLSESNLHNNKYQKMVWALTPAEDGGNTDEKEPLQFTPGNDCSNIPDIAAPSTSDQFEDACCDTRSASSQSFISVKSSSSPITTAYNNLKPPAAPNDHTLQPQSALEAISTAPRPRPRKPKGCRLAANFSNSLEGDDYKEITNTNEQKFVLKEDKVGEASGKEDGHEDALAILGSAHAPLAPFRFRNGHRSTGVIFNNLHPSQRVLSSDVLPQIGPFYASAGSTNEFSLNLNDFPAL